MKLYFFEDKLRHSYDESDYLVFEGEFLNDSIPFKARFKVIDSSSNTDVNWIDAEFGRNSVEFVTSGGNVFQGSVVNDVLKPWLISELRRNEAFIYSDSMLVTRGTETYKFVFKVLVDIEPYKVQFTYFDVNPQDEWTIVVESENGNLRHSGETSKYKLFPFLKNYYDNFFVAKLNEIENFKKIRLY